MQKGKDLKRDFGKLRRLPLCDEGSSSEQLLVLGADDYWRIRSTRKSILGVDLDKDSGADSTMLGWMLCGRTQFHNMPLSKEFFLSSSQLELASYARQTSKGWLNSNKKRETNSLMGIFVNT